MKLKSLGLYKDNDHEKPGHGYGKSIFDYNLETVCNVDFSYNAEKDFEIEGLKYHLNKKDLDDLSLQGANTHFETLTPSNVIWT